MIDPVTKTKMCSKCRAAPALSYVRYCRGCHNERQKAHYRKSPASIQESAIRRKNRLREVSREGREKPCSDCGKRYPFYVMDYDHVRGEKSFGIATVRRCTYTEERLLEEIAKCDVVCSNCHRERTWTRKHPTCKIAVS